MCVRSTSEAPSGLLLIKNSLIISCSSISVVLFCHRVHLAWLMAAFRSSTAPTWPGKMRACWLIGGENFHNCLKMVPRTRPFSGTNRQLPIRSSLMGQDNEWAFNYLLHSSPRAIRTSGWPGNSCTASPVYRRQSNGTHMVPAVDRPRCPPSTWSSRSPAPGNSVRGEKERQGVGLKQPALVDGIWCINELWEGDEWVRWEGMDGRRSGQSVNRVICSRR